MKTKIQLVTKAFDELRINGITSKADSEDVILALDSQEEFVSELKFDIGWRFEPDPDPNTMSGIPQLAERAVYMGLAVRLAPRYGKDPNMYRSDAQSALISLMSAVKRVRQVNNSTRMPMGLGNRRIYNTLNQFMPRIDEAPNTVNTEVFVIGDVRQLSVDLTNYLQPSELIDTYTLTPSGGIVVTNQALSDNVITFTVEANTEGYQSAAISVTGDAGTVSNRTLDFQINAAQTIRGNP